MARIAGSEARIADLLVGLFDAHGVRAVRADGPRPSFLARLFGATATPRVTFPDRPGFWAEGAAFRNPVHHHLITQVDILLGLPDGRVVGESFTGMGDDLDTRIGEAVARFAVASLHVLITAFFDLPDAGGAGTEVWDIGGERRQVVLGPVVSRFNPPPSSEWQDRFTAAIRATRLPPGVHWVRLYELRKDGRSMGGEVQLDNQTWPELEQAVAGFDWPDVEGMYDVRLFLVVGPVETA